MRLRDLSLTTLRTATTIADLGSMTRAAVLLHLTQPALSYQLRRLEEAAGQPLFERSRHGMRPTPAGQRLLTTARRILDEVDVLDRDLARLAAGVEGRLRVGSECATSYHWLPEVAAAYREELPAVQVELRAQPSAPAEEVLRRGEVDVALTTRLPRGDDLQVRPLFADEIMAVVAPDHPFVEREFLVAEDFADQTVYVSGLDTSDLFNLVLRPAGVRPRHAGEIAVTEGLVEMVRSGLGIGALASWIVAPQLAAGDLVARPITREGLTRHWYAVTGSGASVPSFVTRFVEVLVETLSAAREGSAQPRPRCGDSST
jgi:LysR family transcriptional regulator for metE and metH